MPSHDEGAEEKESVAGEEPRRCPSHANQVKVLPEGVEALGRGGGGGAADGGDGEGMLICSEVGKQGGDAGGGGGGSDGPGGFVGRAVDVDAAGQDRLMREPVGRGARREDAAVGGP